MILLVLLALAVESPIAVPKPDVSVKRGFYEAPFTLTLTNERPGVTIHYTLNGNPPTEASATYTSPLTISNTTVLRATAFDEQHTASKTVTHTYLFLDQVIHQPNNPAGFPSGPTVMAGYPSDYEMDPEIVNDPAYGPQMKSALQGFPALSIAMKLDDLFNPNTGIYTHPLSRGPQWERPCSIEFIPLDGKDFQENAGIQMQGNAAREPVKQPKHPLRLVFKEEYGATRLREKIFPDSAVDSFDTLILRADFNYSWLHWNPTQRIRAQRMRDAWMKDTMRAMGGLASHNRYFHLYINGVYWGIYDASERPDGSFGEAYLGGHKEDYDVINEGAVVDGSFTPYQTLLSFTDVSTLEQYDAIKDYLDMPQFIDYMLLHFFVGHEDWGKDKNWYAIRPKDGSRGFLYIPWDGENILGDANANRVTNPDVPSGLHTKLIASAEYRLAFADRVRRHLFNGGALTPEETIRRWQARARDLELPIIAESARWGDYRRDVHQYQSGPYDLYTRDQHWRAERNRLLTAYFPRRTATVLNQLRAVGLYPSVEAPSLNQYGGKINSGFQLALSAPSGKIYFTTNGVDPRTYGSGQISPEAVLYSAPISLLGPTHVKARVLTADGWSALTEATFSTASFRVPLRLTEIMYNPGPSADAFEYLEFHNTGTLPFDASGYALQGVDYIFPPGSIFPPGQMIIIGSARDPVLFDQHYPALPVFGRFSGQLSNGGERLALISPSGKSLYSVDYSDHDGWPVEADGTGASLEIMDPNGPLDDPANWQDGFSPAKVNSVHTTPIIRLNEVLASPVTGPDWVELQNTTTTNIDLSNWILREAGNTNKMLFPNGTVLEAGAYLVIPCDRSTQPLHAPFALDADAETLILEDPTARRVDILTTGPQVQGFSVGFVDGQYVLNTPTPAQPNTAAPLGSTSTLVVNEWLASSSSGPDWFELYNTDLLHPVSLRGLFLGTTDHPDEITSLAYIAPGGHVRLFADEEPGANHVDFKLPAEGATLSLYDSTERVIDSVTYNAQSPGVSQGFYPDGTHNLVSFPISPSPGQPNSLSFPLTFSRADGKVVVSWPSLNGVTYELQRSEDLVAWTKVSDLIATGATAFAEDSATAQHSYYRVVALPNP